MRAALGLALVFVAARCAGHNAPTANAPRPEPTPPAASAAPAPTPSGPFLDPAKAALPAGCTYSKPGILRTGGEIDCEISSGAFSLAHLDLDDVWVRITVADGCAGPVAMTFGPNRLRAGRSEKIANGDMVHIDPTVCPFDRNWIGDTFDGDFHPGDPGTFEAVRDNACDGNETWREVTFARIPGRPVSDAFGQCATAGHNQFRAERVRLKGGMALATDGDHGEVWEFGPSRRGAVPVDMTYDALALDQPGAPASNTALLWLGSGSDDGPLNIGTLTIRNSMLTCEARGARLPCSRIIGTASATIGNLVFTGNRLGGGGAAYCFLNDGATHIGRIVWRGDTHVPDGKPITGFAGYGGRC